MKNVRNESSRAFLRWAGSKKQLLPELRKSWVEDCRYVEPFAGSACLFFSLRPKAALLGDMNKELMDTYLAVKYDVAEVVAALCGYVKSREHYLEVRRQDVAEFSRPERAARFIFLNRFCFNGLYRTNQSGQFNVPYGGEKAGYLPNEELLRNCSRMLQRATIRAWDFEQTLGKVVPGDFVYMDPPFHVVKQRVFREYTSTEFGDKKLSRVRFWMEKLADQKIPFLVSYAESEEARELEAGFFSRPVTVIRNIAGFSASRGKAKEILISNIKF